MTSSSTFPIHYTLGGKMLLMQWWSHNEQAHVILAKSERAMLETASRVFNENNDAEIRAYLEVDIVAPPNRLCDLVPKFDYNDNVRQFQVEMTWRLKELLREGRTLPAQFKECKSYEPVDDESDSPSSEWQIEYHDGCKNCHERIVFGMTSEELYDKYGQRWAETDPQEQKFRRNRQDRDRRLPSRAEQARDDEPLWCAVANFGHHSGGLILEEVSQEPITDFNSRPVYLSDRAIFFYRKLAELDASKSEEMLWAIKNRISTKRNLEKTHFETRRKAENEKHLDQIQEFFSK